MAPSFSPSVLILLLLPPCTAPTRSPTYSPLCSSEGKESLYLFINKWCEGTHGKWDPLEGQGTNSVLCWHNCTSPLPGMLCVLSWGRAPGAARMAPPGTPLQMSLWGGIVLRALELKEGARIALPMIPIVQAKKEQRSGMAPLCRQGEEGMKITEVPLPAQELRQPLIQSHANRS